MTQTFMAYAVEGSQRTVLTRALGAAGYQVGDSRRMTPGILVRVRTCTADAAEVERLVAEYAAGAKKLPPSSPTMNVRGYRDGYS